MFSFSRAQHLWPPHSTSRSLPWLHTLKSNFNLCSFCFLPFFLLFFASFLCFHAVTSITAINIHFSLMVNTLAIVNSLSVGCSACQLRLWVSDCVQNCRLAFTANRRKKQFCVHSLIRSITFIDLMYQLIGPVERAADVQHKRSIMDVSANSQISLSPNFQLKFHLLLCNNRNKLLK